MAVQSRVSLVNHMANATFWQAGHQQTGWPYTNLKYPQQPFVLWKTDDLTGDKDAYVDFGSNVVFDVLAAVNLNVNQMQIFLDTDTGFSPANYSSGTLTVTRNPWNRRYTLVHVFPSQQTQRYMIFRIPDTATAFDGNTYASVGGLWVGPWTTLPTDIRWDEVPRIIEPKTEMTLLGGGTHRVSTGRPYVEMTARRLAGVEISTPATGDELGTWLDVDRQMAEAGHFLWYFNRGNTAEAFIMRRMNDAAWNVNQAFSEDEFVLHEVCGP